MSDSIWRKVSELTKGYPPQFNAQAAHDLVEAAWRMGFDVVKAPLGSDLYNRAMQEKAMLMSNAPQSSDGTQNAYYHPGMTTP